MSKRKKDDTTKKAEFFLTRSEVRGGNRFGVEQPPKAEFERKVKFYGERLEAYGYDQRNPRASLILARYFAAYYLGTAQKGLCLIGDTGRGKTLAMKIMSKLFGIRIIHAYDLAEKWQTFGVDGREEFWGWLHGSYVDHSAFGKKYVNIDRLCHDVIIDDIGTEPTMSDYGVKQEIMACVQQKRLTKFEAPRGPMVHFTSNLAVDGESGKKDTLEARYGTRFASRLKAMCFIVHVDGDDWRVQKYDTRPTG